MTLRSSIWYWHWYLQGELPVAFFYIPNSHGLVEPSRHEKRGWNTNESVSGGNLPQPTASSSGEAKAGWGCICEVPLCLRTLNSLPGVTQQPPVNQSWASLVAQMVKNLPAMQKTHSDSWVEKILWRKEWQPTPVFLPGKSHGQRSLVRYSPWGWKELDTTEQLTLSLFLNVHGSYALQSHLKHSMNDWP